MIRPASAGDVAALAELRHSLWPEGSREEHARELVELFGRAALSPMEILVAETEGGRVVGFCEVSVRPCAEGCVTQGVGYLEGWYVEPSVRRRGLGRELVAAAEEWARRQGCREFASDTAQDNRISAAAHRALGFTEVGLVRCFRKVL